MSMNSEQRDRDDLKKVFDDSLIPDLPLQLEDKIMAGIEIQKLRAKRHRPFWFTTNLVIFSLSIFVFVLMSVLRFATQWDSALLQDVNMVALLTTAVFFILWLVETMDAFLQHRLKSKMQTNFK